MCALFQILHCTGTTIKPFSELISEDDVLLMPRARFRVVHAKRSSNLGWNRADVIILEPCKRRAEFKVYR